MLKYVLISLSAVMLIYATAQALEPGNFPLTIYANEDFRLNLTHTAYSSPVNLTGYTFKLQAKKAYGQPAFVTFSSAVSNAAAGQTTHWLTKRSTAANAKTSGVYDLMQTAPDGTVSYKLKGTIQFIETVTR
jgi:hypothetical protein